MKKRSILLISILTVVMLLSACANDRDSEAEGLEDIQVVLDWTPNCALPDATKAAAPSSGG